MNNWTRIGALGALLALAGCATTGGSQTSNAIYATHNIVRKLDQNLGGSVEKLNATAAELNARVDETERQTREILGKLEENQRQLAQLDSKLSDLMRAVYQEFKLTPPSSSPSVYVNPAEITVAPPSPAPSTAPVEPEGLEQAQPGAAEAPVRGEIPSAARPPAVTGQAPASAVDLYRQAQQRYQEENYQEALRLYSEYVQRYPNTDLADNAQFWKGVCCFKLNDFQGAISEYEKLRQNYPNSDKAPNAMNNQATAHARIGQQQTAIRLYEEVIKNYPMTTAAEQARQNLELLKGAQ